MIVRIALYKASTRSWTDMLIAGWTWLWNPSTKAYSHAEIGFGFADGIWTYFSSTIRTRIIEGKRTNGTRWIQEDILLKNPKRWDVFEAAFSEEEIKEMIDRANEILGCEYDKLGILGFITLTGKLLNDKDKWYCSEAVWYILTGQWRKRISPRRLSAIIQEMGFESCENI